jgi:hypothetical protein
VRCFATAEEAMQLRRCWSNDAISGDRASILVILGYAHSPLVMGIIITANEVKNAARFRSREVYEREPMVCQMTHPRADERSPSKIGLC